MAETLRIPSVTGIDVELKVAGPGGRSFAFIIDWKIRVLAALSWLIMATAVQSIFAAGSGAPGEAFSSAFFIFAAAPAIAIYFLYHPVLEVLMRGRTPGKAIANVRIVRLADGGTPSVGALLIRNVFRLIDSMPSAYALGLATTMFTKNAVRIGDIAAGTVLVYDEPEQAAKVALLHASAIERLGLGEAQLVRELADRWWDLSPIVRARLARQLLARHGIDAQADSEIECGAKLRALLA